MLSVLAPPGSLSSWPPLTPPGTLTSWLPSWAWLPGTEAGAKIQEIQLFYQNQVLPLEEKYLFHTFHSPPMKAADFSAKPLVMLVGQYSTGKTTALRYLLGRDFPGQEIGKPPTTREFILVDHGADAVVPGRVLLNDPTSQFRTLSKYGTAFANMFLMSTTLSPVLERVSFLDTPGILSEKEPRDYDHIAVLEWFAERADRILLFFDADKLDISEEFRRTLERFSGMEDKLRFVLNKCDMEHEELLRVYGSLMWSLGRELRSPEGVPVYIGSFRDSPLVNKVFQPLIESETQKLLTDLQAVVAGSADRKLSDMIKRTKKAKAHALVLAKTKEVLGTGWLFESSKQAKMKEIIGEIQERIFDPIITEYSISPQDFPDPARMQEMLGNKDFELFEAIDKEMLAAIDEWMTDLATVAQIEKPFKTDLDDTLVPGGAFDGLMDNKWSFLESPHVITEEDKKEASAFFRTLKLSAGAKVDGMLAKKEMVKSGLPRNVLQRIWKLSDVDGDWKLSQEEYRVISFLMRRVLEGKEVPSTLPPDLLSQFKTEKVETKGNIDEL